MDMAAAMGIELLTEEQYRELQELGEFETKTSSWVQTPADIRRLGGALFCDRRYNHVFVYHNGGVLLRCQGVPRLAQSLFRAGHAHAGVYLVLSLVMLRYVDEAALSSFWKWLARVGAPIAAILIPAAFFLSVASPQASEPNALINLAYVGAAFLAAAVLTLGVGLIRAGDARAPVR